MCRARGDARDVAADGALLPQAGRQLRALRRREHPVRAATGGGERPPGETQTLPQAPSAASEEEARPVAGGGTRGPRRARAVHARAGRYLARRATPHAPSRRRGPPRASTPRRRPSRPRHPRSRRRAEATQDPRPTGLLPRARHPGTPRDHPHRFFHVTASRRRGRARRRRSASAGNPSRTDASPPPGEPARPSPIPPPTPRAVAEENMRASACSRGSAASLRPTSRPMEMCRGEAMVRLPRHGTAAARAYNEVARILGARLNDVSDAGTGDEGRVRGRRWSGRRGDVAGTAARAALAVAQPSNVASLEAEGNTNGSPAGLEATSSPGSFVPPSPAVPFASPSGWFLPRRDMNRHVDPDETDVDDDSDDEAAGLPPRSPPERKPRWRGGARAKDEVGGVRSRGVG